MKKKLTMLAILDGLGCGESSDGNAISISGIPNIKKLMERYPNSRLGASGLEVGLPEGQMGNSEVGHLNIGAGRIVYQELTRITKAIADGDFFSNQAFIDLCKKLKANGGKLHLFGLLSNGGVHSHIDHLFALIKLAKDQGLSDVFIHGFLDGRDVSPTSGADFIAKTFAYTKEMGFGKIASICGRYYAMDRDNRWERVEEGYNMMTKGVGELTTCPYQSVKKAYENGVTDEFIKPKIVSDNGKPVATIQDNDGIIFFNYRPDRAREITRCFIEKDFKEFEKAPINVSFVSMTQYKEDFKNITVAYKPQALTNTLGEYVANLGKTQLRIAETEKYAHVTFFFNGGEEAPNKNEDRILIPSPKVATYDMQPEMSANEVCDEVMKAIEEEKYDLIILNFANCDMVGHTGIVEATVKAVDTVDKCIGKIAKLISEKGGSLLITADHGNADKMKEADGSPFTAHTTNPVPLILVDDAKTSMKLEDGCLADIAPTILNLMGLEQPSEMTGKSLIKK